MFTEEKTSKRDLVTQYDCKVQDFLIKRLKKSLPNACFYCEEQGKTDNLNAECLFIIDPIDGTMNFIKKFHHSCISIAYAKKGELLCSAIYNPYTDEMFTSIKNGGAFLNNKPTVENIESQVTAREFSFTGVGVTLDT